MNHSATIRFLKSNLLPSFALAAACLSLPAQATTVIGGSDLLDSASAIQLESWLGQGAIQLTNVFDKAIGDQALDFHAAVDGLGATFSVIEVLGDANGLFAAPIIVGGYNPQSWDTNGGYHITNDDVDRTAFLFNFSAGQNGTGIKLDQRKDGPDTDPNYLGSYQTLNSDSAGPTFGYGHDLYVNNELSGGTSTLYSYGNEIQDTGRSLVAYPELGLYELTFGQIEVFTIAAAVAEPVPEPGTIVLMLSGLGVMGFVAKRRRI